MIMEGSATPGDNRETHAAGVLTKIHATLATLEDKGVNAAFGISQTWDTGRCSTPPSAERC